MGFCSHVSSAGPETWGKRRKLRRTLARCYEVLRLVQLGRRPNGSLLRRVFGHLGRLGLRIKSLTEPVESCLGRRRIFCRASSRTKQPGLLLGKKDSMTPRLKGLVVGSEPRKVVNQVLLWWTIPDPSLTELK